MSWRELKWLGIRLRCLIYCEILKIWSVFILKFICSRLWSTRILLNFIIHGLIQRMRILISLLKFLHPELCASKCLLARCYVYVSVVYNLWFRLDFGKLFLSFKFTFLNLDTGRNISMLTWERWRNGLGRFWRAFRIFIVIIHRLFIETLSVTIFLSTGIKGRWKLVI